MPSTSHSALARSPIWDNVARTIRLHNVKLIFTLPRMQEPTNILLLEPLAIVIKGLPVLGILGNANVTLSGIVVRLAPSPRAFRNHGGKVDVIQNPLRSLLDISPGLTLRVVAVVEGHGVDMSKVRVGLDPTSKAGQTISIAQGTWTVPILTDANLDAMLLHFRAECSEVIHKVAGIHAITDGLGAPVSAVDNIWCNGGKFGLVECVINGLLRLSPNVLLQCQS